MFYVDLSELAGSKKDEEIIASLHKMAGKDLLFRTDLYQPIPKDQAKLDLVFRYNRQPRHPEHRQSCISVEILTAYQSGVICYDQEDYRLGSFIDTESKVPATN